MELKVPRKKTGLFEIAIENNEKRKRKKETAKQVEDFFSKGLLSEHLIPRK